MWFAQAPANIAFVKYMGKTDSEQNLPSNPSLSYTLPDLLSFVEIDRCDGERDRWEPLQIPGAKSFSLSDAGQQRFLAHLAYMKSLYNVDEPLVIRSCNNFPMSAGLASSASSYAALTRCADLALSELSGTPTRSIDELAAISRHGSGSSCRSFYSPYALWDGDNVTALNTGFTNLIHHVVLISDHEKAVSSSQAHERVQSSPEFAGRAARAAANLRACSDALDGRHWAMLFDVLWRDFMDMHHLFATSAEPFSYITADGQALLDELQQYWTLHNDGPLVTMDAGPNIHLLFREDQADLAHNLRLVLLKDHDIL